MQACAVGAFYQYEASFGAVGLYLGLYLFHVGKLAVAGICACELMAYEPYVLHAGILEHADDFLVLLMAFQSQLQHVAQYGHLCKR